MQSKFLNIDCMEYMKDVDDNYFDLAMVDPPYGIGVDSMNLGNSNNKNYNNFKDIKPNKIYFDELFRVSKNQIIWGGNYFSLPVSKFWIIWDKNNGSSDFADGEMAWGSFDKQMKIIKIHWTGSASKWEDTNGKIHPTQKPVALYRWLLQNYAKENDKIFDSHVGSGSSLIACIEEGFDYVGCEIDKDYFKSASERINIHKSQGRLF